MTFDRRTLFSVLIVKETQKANGSEDSQNQGGYS